MLITRKSLLGLLAILLLLGFGMGCKLPSGDENSTVYSYNLGEMERGIFNSPTHTMTLNAWFPLSRPWDTNTSYDTWSQSEKQYFYKDKKLKARFSGSDMVNENTVFYCDFVYYWQRKKIGDITGSITLTSIFSPTPKVWIQGSTNSTYFWRPISKINMNKATGTATLNWSMAVYGNFFEPPIENRFTLYVLPNGSNYGLEVPVPTVKTINNANMNVGDLGTVDIKSVSLNGTINITYNGKPVPYVILMAIRQGGTANQDTCFYSPSSNTTWSMFFEPTSYNRDIVFQVLGFSKENPTADDMIIDTSADIPAINVTNKDVTGIVLDFGDFPRN
jgi:hypothetical protein